MVESVEVNRIFHGLADPTRLAILERLAAGPQRVSDLPRPRPMSLQAIAKHVGVLEQSGLIERRRTGRETWCQLKPEALDEAQDWLNRTRRFWSARLDDLAAAVAREDAGE